MIPKPRDIIYEMRLKECGFTTQETMRLRGNQIEVFKILNGYANIDRSIYLSVRKREKTFSFSQSIVNEWNRLSADCVGAIVVLICLKIKSTYISDSGIHR